MTGYEVRRLLLTGAAASVLVVLPSVHAQSLPSRDASVAYAGDDRDWSDQIPAHLWAVDGAATLEREGRVETAEENVALLAGDRLRTDRGRVEILFEDGSALDVDEFSRVDLLSDSLVRLLDGRVRLTLARGADAIDYRVDTIAGSVVMRSAGEYKIALSSPRAGDPELQVAVLRGQAELANAYGRTALRAGTESVVTERRAPAFPYAVNSAQWDSFDRWVDAIHAERLGTTSSRYLPTELRSYGGAFDNYGSWDYLPSSGGYAWYPNVAVGWRPYSVGRWSFYGNFGWFWIGAGRWTWPTHHYGRWGLHSNRWYWVPGRHWAPAWVAWGGAPGYTSWCPLGFDGRPVVGFSAGRYHDPWSAWTVVPTRVFVNNVVVNRHAVNYGSIAPHVRSQFEVRRSPSPLNVSATRVQPLRSPTMGRAVTRDGARAVSPTGEFDRSPSTPGRFRGDVITPSRSGSAIDATRDRTVAPSIDQRSADQGAARARSRVPTRDDSVRSAPPRLEAPPRPETSRPETPPVSMPDSPRAQPRNRTGSAASPDSDSPWRSYRSREPQQNAPSGTPPSRVYRSPDPDSSPDTAPPRAGWTPSRVPDQDRTSPPPDRGRQEPPNVRSRPSGSSGESPRSEPAARSRVESRPPSGEATRSAPSRTGSGDRSSSSSGSSGRGGGQAVRRGGGV
jgi:hypothetical protein